MTGERDLLVPYRLRAVRVGIQVTLVALATLVTFPILPGHGEIDVGPYVGIVAGAAVGIAAVAVLPWKRLFERGLGLWTLYAWSAFDILLITGAIGWTGGGSSDMFLLYALTTVFFGACYPPRGQVALLAFTFASYVAVLWTTGWEVGAGMLFLRIALLAALALLTSFLARELMRQMASHRNARTQSERWAELLSTVAEAARSMTLDHERVLDVVVESVLRLGFEGAGIAIIDEESRTYAVTHSRGMPLEYAEASHPIDAGMIGLVRRRGRTVTVDDVSGDPEAAPTMRPAGFRSAIASPVWVDAWLTAVLVAGTRERRRLIPHEVRALELLASQAGLALENARRYEEERETVHRLGELDRLKSDFVSTVSHELRTPVAVIKAAGQTLERQWSSLDERNRRELVTGMNANARSLDEIITTLLDFSRLDSGRPAIRLSRIDLQPLLTGIAARLGQLFQDKELRTEVGSDVAVTADPALIERSLENLLSNAAKYTGVGARVRLAARREADGVLIEVEDDGPGITTEDLQHLGNRFFRGGETNTRETKGLGLGLALVREILALHDSELQVESTVGIGSRFWFLLPAADDTIQSAASDPPVPEAADDTPEEGAAAPPAAEAAPVPDPTRTA
jgi:signal transduction histidine kinase